MFKRVILYNQSIVYKTLIYVMIVRLLIYLMVIMAVLYLSRLILLKSAAGSGNPRKVRRSKMVKCGYCQVYLAEQEAVGKPDEYYCSEEHKNRALYDNDQ